MRTLTKETYVITCTGVDGVYGNAVPIGFYLISWDPNAVDPTGQYMGLARWSKNLADAYRFATEADAHECIDSGLAILFRMRIVPIAPVSPAPKPRTSLLDQMREDGTLVPEASDRARATSPQVRCQRRESADVSARRRPS